MRPSGQSASSRNDKLVLRTPLLPAQPVQAVLSYLSSSDMIQAQMVDSFESGGEDWPDAYRHSPMSKHEALLCVVVF